MAIDNTAGKNLLDQARLYAEKFPNNTAEEIVKIVAEKEIYSNRANEELVMAGMELTKNAISLVQNHPNTLDGILLRKLDETYNAFVLRVQQDPEWGTKMAIAGIASLFVDLLEKFGDDSEIWRASGERLVVGYTQQNYSPKAVEQLANMFMQLPGKSSEEAFAYIVEEVSVEKNPELHAEIYKSQEKVTNDSNLKM